MLGSLLKLYLNNQGFECHIPNTELKFGEAPFSLEPHPPQKSIGVTFPNVVESVSLYFQLLILYW